jgi:hypothetical protein
VDSIFSFFWSSASFASSYSFFFAATRFSILASSAFALAANEMSDREF